MESGIEFMSEIEKTREQFALDKIQEIIKKHQKIQSVSCGNSIPEQIENLLQEYHRSAENAYSASGEFRDRLLVDFRALNLILTSALNSETHKEKDSHLRILTKLLTAAAEKLRETHFSAVWGAQFHFNRDPFQCDFPVREMKNRIYELENKIKQLEQPQPES